MEENLFCSSCHEFVEYSEVKSYFITTRFGSSVTCPKCGAIRSLSETIADWVKAAGKEDVSVKAYLVKAASEGFENIKDFPEDQIKEE